MSVFLSAAERLSASRGLWDPESPSLFALVGNAVVEQPTPRQMLAFGLVYLPQDRRDEALALNRSIFENVSLEVLDQPRFITSGGLVRDIRLRETVNAIADQLDIRPRDI